MRCGSQGLSELSYGGGNDKCDAGHRVFEKGMSPIQIIHNVHQNNPRVTGSLRCPSKEQIAWRPVQGWDLLRWRRHAAHQLVLRT